MSYYRYLSKEDVPEALKRMNEIKIEDFTKDKTLISQYEQGARYWRH